LYSVTKFAANEGFLFTNITTNGVWCKDERDLRLTLDRLFAAGYDGAICVSVDAYHKQNPIKLKNFIKTALSIWRRPDLISIAYVTGADRATKNKLSTLARLLGGRLCGFGKNNSYIKGDDFFIKILKIDLSPIGKAANLKDGWQDDRWFKEDYCKGPGNVFFIEPSGAVKPCCGYASGSKALLVGNIKKNSVSDIFKNVRQNRFVYDIFNSGLSEMRKRLTTSGIKFPGKTSNNCFFCQHIINMKKYIALFIVTLAAIASTSAFAQYTEDLQNSDEAPPGIEIKKVNNDVSVLVPKGSKMYMRNKSTYVQESADEYAARQFVETNKRLAKLEEENRQLVEEIKYLKSKLTLQENSVEKDAGETSEN
jgi:hypothetical protein